MTAVTGRSVDLNIYSDIYSGHLQVILYFKLDYINDHISVTENMWQPNIHMKTENNIVPCTDATENHRWSLLDHKKCTKGGITNNKSKIK